jgi:DNA-binding transcriptional regulator GbsR (MarR family)
MARNERALREATEHSAAVLAGAGFPKMAARVLMLLTMTDEGLTAQELAEQLGVSAAAISGAARYLQNVGYVRRTARAGSRRDRYELPDDHWYGEAFSKSPIFDSLATLLEQAVEAIDDPTSKASHRAQETAAFYRFLRDRMPSLLVEWDAIQRKV